MVQHWGAAGGVEVSELVCRYLVPGCELCLVENEYLVRTGHDCPPESAKWHTTCEVFGGMRRQNPEFHRVSHLPQRCEDCGAIVSDNLGTDNLATQLCSELKCTQWVCTACGGVHMSEGPIDCSACSLGFWPRRASTHRMRSLYGRRRRRGRW